MRQAHYSVDPLILNRWSSRAMSGEDVAEEELMSLFDAARWAPSAFNEQPWRFVYVRKGTEQWDNIFSTLVEFNQSWVKNASVMVAIISSKNSSHNDKPFKTHSFDTGAAWQNLALQAMANGLVCHGMSGFDFDAATSALGISDNFELHMIAAIGKPGDKEKLPFDLQEREVMSSRKDLAEFVFEGKFDYSK